MYKILFALLFTSMSAHSEITSYRLELVPNLESKTVKGKANITLAAHTVFNLKGDSLIIESMKLNGKKFTYKKENNQIVIDLVKQNKKSDLVIEYSVVSSKGLVFGNNYLYSNFSTCSWMPCSETPDERFPFELQIVLPYDFKMVGNGREVTVKDEGKKLKRHIWSQSTPYSSYLLGFAAGIFDEVTTDVGGNYLRYLGANDKAEDLKKKFQETESIVSFFEEKSGVSLPNKIYTQVLVPDYEAQEKSSFSLIGKPFLDPIVTDPQEDWVIVHELAHQWWGNSITCKNWDHFWLNEGLTVFMTAAYKQKKWGEESYKKEIELAKARYQKAIEAKIDVPLTFSGPYPSLQLKRAIVYSKGALFLDELRKFLGDEMFWKALRDYTMSFNGKLVESKDFQVSFEKTSGKNLSEIFNKWVY